MEGFRGAFERHAATLLREEDLVPRCRIEGWVAEGDLTPRAAEDLARRGPYGAGAAQLKLTFGRGLDAIGFSMGDGAGLCQGPVEAAFTLGFDDRDGTRRLQLKLRNLRAAG